MTHAALQDDFEIFPEAVIGEFHGKAPVTADRNGCITAFVFFAGGKDRLACCFFVCKFPSLHLHSDKILFWQRMCFHGFQILLEPCDIPLVPFDLCREIFQQLILQPVLLALVVCFQHFQSCHIHIQIHLFPDQRIARAQRFDLRIGKGLLIHIVTGAYRRFTGHDLADEFLLVLQCLIEVSVEGSLRHILEDFDLRVLVSLPDDTSVSLRHIRRPPAHIQMVDSDQAVLHIRTGSHLLGTAKKHANLSGADLGKQLFLLCLCVGIMDKCDLCCRDTGCHQFTLDIVIDVEGSVILRCGKIAEHQLCQLPVFSVFPDLQHIVHTGVELASRIIREKRVHESLVEADLPAVGSDLQHVVNGRIHAAAVHPGRPLGKRSHHILLDLGRLHHHRFKLCIGNRQIQLITGLDIRHFLKHGHEFRQVKELGEACPGTVAGSFRSQFNGRGRFSEGGSPAVKVRKPFLLQRPVLEITHDRVKLRHGIADRCAGSEHDTPAAGDLIHVPAFHKHIRGLLCL